MIPYKLFKLVGFALFVISFTNCNNTSIPENLLEPIENVNKNLNVYMCVDMEGMSGIVHVKDCNEGGMDYQYFRELATQEVNAAIRGAYKAGATKVVVRDAHETMRNIIPSKLDNRAELIRGGDGANPEIMMQGIEEGFDLMVFIGHHSGAGTPRGVLAHTMVVDGIQEFTINGKQIPEMAYCALIASKYGVPVAYFTGDDVACQQAKDIFGEDLVTTETKKAMGWKVAKCYNSEKVHKQIEKDIMAAIKNKNYNLYKMEAPYNCYLKVKEGKDANGSPIIKEYSWESSNLDEAFNYFWERI